MDEKVIEESFYKESQKVDWDKLLINNVIMKLI